MGETESEALKRTETEIPCPFRDGQYGRGETVGRALEDLLYHIRDSHTSAVPEPPREQLRTGLTGCAHLLGENLPV